MWRGHSGSLPKAGLPLTPLTEKIVKNIFSRLRRSITYRLLHSKFFKDIFIRHVHTYRIHYPEWRNSWGVDFTFIEYSHGATPPSPYLHDIVNGAVHLLDEEWRANPELSAPSSKLKCLYDYNNHYLLLTSIARVLKARRIVEIGTAAGMSLWSWLRSENVENVSTWDVNPLKTNKGWFQTDEIRRLVEEFIEKDSRWTQYVEDLSDAAIWSSRVQLLRDADIIFIDGPHDGAFEHKLVKMVLELNNEQNILLIFDDILTSAMVDVWRSLPLPKFDASSVGHRSGTGIALLAPRSERDSNALVAQEHIYLNPKVYPN